MIYTVYILESIKKNKYYIGQTNDLHRRVKEHNMGRSKSTKFGIPWRLIYSKKFPDRRGAVELERTLKKHKKRIYIEKFISS